MKCNVNVTPSESTASFINCSYFGEWEPLFEIKERAAQLIAGGEVILYAMEESTFLDLLSQQVRAFPTSCKHN